MAWLELWLESVAATPLAQWIRFSRWGYAVVNSVHVLGIALLVGAIVPLDLRLIGFWRTVNLKALAQVLVPVAVTGLMFASVSGLLLFMAAPSDYAALPVFLFKLLCIWLAVANALYFHWRIGYSAKPAVLKLAGAASLLLWLLALFAGRLIAYF